EPTGCEPRVHYIDTADPAPFVEFFSWQHLPARDEPRRLFPEHVVHFTEILRQLQELFRLERLRRPDILHQMMTDILAGVPGAGRHSLQLPCAGRGAAAG